MRIPVCALVSFLCLAGVGAAQERAGAGRTCRDGAARFAVGQRYSESLAERARRAARAAVTREIAPGQTYTMEFRPDRLNLETDGRGIVRRLRCG